MILASSACVIVAPVLASRMTVAVVRADEVARRACKRSSTAAALAHVDVIDEAARFASPSTTLLDVVAASD